MLAAVVRAVARLYPLSVDPSGELERSLRFLGRPVSGETVLRAGYGGAILVGMLTALAAGFTPGGGRTVVVATGGMLALGVIHAARRGPRLLATARRTRALGAAPSLVSRAVLRMRIAPAPEAAAAFAADTGEGPLAESLGEQVRRAEGTGRTGFGRFAAEWREWFPALERAALLIESAGGAPADERDRTLDRALERVLEGTSEQASAFAGQIQGPATAVYAFGVMLPLALVGLLPAVGVAGVAVPLSAVVAVYDVALPAALVGAGAWLLARRPATFPPPRIDRSHPRLPDRRWPPAVAGGIAGAGGWLGAAAVLPDWTVPVAALGCGIGTGLVVRYRPVKRVRDRIRAVESGLADALYQIGRRIEAGLAVEAAIAAAADDVPGETGSVLADAARRGRQLGIGVEEAFLGEHGALADVPSSRARSTAALVVLAAREGRPAGEATVAMADHLESLASVESDARREIARVTHTLANTAAVFAPLVAGATVGLADATAGADLATGGPRTAGLGLVVGGYVLVLAVLLTGLATGLSRGLDRALVGYRTGWALLAATGTYLASFAATGALV